MADLNIAIVPDGDNAYMDDGPFVSGPKQYIDNVLLYNPATYWPFNESSGSTALNYGTLGAAANATYTGVTLGHDTTGPFGTAAPLFDGTTDKVDLHTAALTSAWDSGGDEWTFMAWWRVYNSAVWYDSTYRHILIALDDANNSLEVYRHAADTLLTNRWTGGGVLSDYGLISTATTWQCTILTRSESADEVKYYVNGSLLETDTSLGTWASASPWTGIVVGNLTWYGWIAHVATFPYALTQPIVTALSNP